MDKVWLIIEREYLTRVRKKSFLIMSILGPLLIAGFYGVIIWSALAAGDDKTILVIDDSKMFGGKFKSSDKLTFYYGTDRLPEAIATLGSSSYNAVLYIPKFDLEDPNGFQVYSAQTISSQTEANIRKTIEREIEELKLKKEGIDPALLKKVKTNISLETKLRDQDGEEKDSSTLAATGIGILSGIIIYMFIFLYGVQVMRGVLEEKISRIVEVIISSVKPFQLMLGKVIGIAGVGLTQICIWIVLGTVIMFVVNFFLSDQLTAVQDLQNVNGSMNMHGVSGIEESLSDSSEFFKALATINIPLILGCFVFYFLFGYLMYGALFGAIGSAVDSETDTQQFMLPITIPLVMSIALSGVILNEPYGDLAFWFSIFPLTSPVVMMIRLPFIGVSWELFLSMFMLVLSFLACTWIAGRIYRVGILMYGKKPTYKELSKWLFYKS
ncbi:MAG: ABC transporter permease [Flammeovirgaceae bacterium]